MANNSVLAKMAVQITAQNAQFASALAKSRRDLSTFTNGLTKVAGALGIAFGVKQVADFALEVSRLSGEAQAVRAAFERLPESTKLMKDLKAATGGTVSELDLMKRAVQASNFDISLQALPRLLEFATLRAQQTGQSVDYLVDSIVTGIGRKSKLILDNLGISAVQLTEALGGATAASSSIGEVAEAVGKIAEENLKNMETFSENASTKLQRLAATWGNVKVAIGDAANSTNILGGSIDAISGSLDVLASKDLSFLEKLGFLGTPGGVGVSNAMTEIVIRQQEKMNKEAEKQKQIIREVDHAFKEFNGDIDAYGKAITTHIYRTELLAEFTKRLTKDEDDRVTTLKELQAQEKELNDIFYDTDITDKKKQKNTAAQILAIRAQIKAIEDLLNVEKKKKPKELKMVFTPDLEAEGSLNPELRNDQARNQALEFSDALNQVATSAEFAGGAVIKLEDNVGGLQGKMKEMIDLSQLVAAGIADIAIGLGQASAGAANFGDVILHSLGGFMEQFGAALIALGIGKINLEAFSGPGMIAAGFALAAAGSALQSSIQRDAAHIGSNGGSSSSAGTGVSRFTASTSVQDSAPQLVTVLKGQDLWIILQNYQANNRLTHG